MKKNIGVTCPPVLQLKIDFAEISSWHFSDGNDGKKNCQPKIVKGSFRKSKKLRLILGYTNNFPSEAKTKDRIFLR